MFPSDKNCSSIVTSLPSVNIGEYVVGEGHPPIFLPDIDVYFKQDINKAFYLIDSIVEAGGQFLKGAVLHRQSLCLNSSQSIKYFNNDTNEMITEPYDSVIARHVVPLDVLDRVMGHAIKAGLKIVLSIYDMEGLAFAKSLNALAVKIPSSNITHKAMIEAVSDSGLPMILDTGRSRFTEVIRAVGWVRKKGAGRRLILQHSPPGPPAKSSLFHLRMMPYMSKFFACPVGLSDHHGDTSMFPLAVALGAGVVEKGLIVDGGKSDIDTAHALPVSRLKEALILLEDSWSAMGENVRPDDEVPQSSMDRMCIVAGREIAEGEMITMDSIDFAFPPVGIGAENIDALIGATSVASISKGQPISFDDIGGV